MPCRRLSTLLLACALAATATAQVPTEKVLERYQQILEKTPTEGTALDRLWKMYLEAGKTEELIARYRERTDFPSALILGHLLRKAGDLDGATAAYERAATLDAANPLPLFSLAKLHTEAARPREAAPVLEKALALLPENDPRKVETLLQLGAAWLGAGEVAKSGEAWESAVALNPGDLDLRRRLAENYAKNSLAARAVPHLEYVAAHAPPAERALALQQLARVHQGAGNQDEAIRALESALALTTPENWLRAELQSQLIRLHQRYHRTDELEARWKRFAEENPHDAGAHFQLIDLYERLGNLDEQRAWLEKLVALLPRHWSARLRLARLSVQMDRLGAATALYDQLLAEQPANADFVFERARLDVQRDATEEARARIAALLAAKGNDEAVRARALEFYEQHRLLDLLEKHLVEDAAGGAPDAVTALATFHFSQRREADALIALDRLVPANAEPAMQAAAHLRIAQILRTENNLPAAVLALEKAASFTPESRECQMLLGELQAGRGEKSAALAAYERALAASTTPAEQLEADQKLFETMRQQPSRPPGAPEAATLPNLALQHYLATLQGRATTEASEEAWLRFARWQAWAGDLKPALLSAQKALEVNAGSVAAYEFIVRQHVAEGTLPAAITQLARLAEIDPPRRAEYQRRAGQLELQAGRVAEALVIFNELSTTNPGSIDALTDLALALQRGDRWTDALETWRRIYELSPVSKKKEALAPLLRALERLELHDQAAKLMLKAIETEPDERAQFAQFADLLAFCTKHDLLDWLHEAFELRRGTRADDYFTEMAMGRILKASGNKAAAFELLSDASYAAPDQAESLPELVREAEELRKLDAAVKLQAQLVRISRQHRPEGLEKLAQLQEKNFDLEEAAATWDRIVAKFPRDAAALQRAIDFQTKWGSPERALELLRRLRKLDPANLRALASLADLALEAGQTAEAEGCLEELLRLAPAGSAEEPLRIPELKAEDAVQLQLASRALARPRDARLPAEALPALRLAWSGESTGARGDRDFRLHAIRQLGQLLQARGDRAPLDAWIARWRAAAATPNEKLWALHYAGAPVEALDLLEPHLAGDSGDASWQNAFLWLGLHTRQYARLAAWTNAPERTPAERRMLTVALDQHLQARGRAVDPALVRELFAGASLSRLWEAAEVFEKRARLREAAALGQRVFDALSTQRARYGTALAGWYLRLGEVEHAREILRLSIETTAESFDAPVYAALRAYWLLLPPGDRPAFAEEYLARLEREAHPLHRAISGTLLRGLAGHEAAARADLERIIPLGAMAYVNLDDGANSGGRRWAFLLSAGMRLISWKLEPLAAFLWDRALADTALIELEGELALETSRDIRRRLQALRIIAAGAPEAAREIVESYARSSTKDGLAQLAETLDNAGAHAQAVLVHRQLWEEDPGNAQLLRNLITTCRAAQDPETAEAALTRVVEGGLLRGNEVAQHDNLLQLAEMLEGQQRTARARTLLGAAIAQSPRDSRLALRYAQLAERSGEPAEAIATYQRVLASEPRNFAAQLALATQLETQGDLAGAIQVLHKGTSSEAESRLALLRAKSGEIDDALTSLDRISAPQNVWPAIHVATVVQEKGEPKLARAILQTALDRNGDPRMRFPLQAKVVELLAPEAGEIVARRELRRLRQIADEQPELLGSYFDLARQQCDRLGMAAVFSRELEAAWAGGTGPAAAGLALLTAQLGAKAAEADATFERLLARQDLSELWLGRIADALRTAQRFDLAAAVYAELAATNRLNDEHVLDGARALHQAGRGDEARTTLGHLEAVAVLNDELAGRLGAAYAACGDAARARLFFQQAIHGDALARHYPTHVALARLQVAAGEFAPAKRTLRAAFANPANEDFAAIVEWLVASGRSAQFGAELAEFGLTPARLTRLSRALFAHFEKAGDAAQAAAVLEARPETIEPGTAARLRTLAQTSRNFSAAAEVLEKLVALSSEPPDLPVELARLYGAWAEAEIEASALAPALAHLQHAHKLQPALFEIAFRLATVQAERSDRAAAIVTLDTFLAASKDEAEIVKARAFLAKLKDGTRP